MAGDMSLGELEGKKILVLGGAGYIGRHIVPILSDNGGDVTVFDKKPKKEVLESNKYIQGSIEDRLSLEKAIKNIDPNVIIDLAALTEVDENKSLFEYRENFCSPGIIAEIISANKNLSVSKVIFTSSQYVIGPNKEFRKLLAYFPHTDYGQSKVLMEQQVFNHSSIFKAAGVSLAIIRPTNVWGGEHPKYANLWEPLLVRRLVAIPNKKVTKSYCHISTLIEIYLAVIAFEESPEEFEDLIFYASDPPILQSEWVDMQAHCLREVSPNAGYFKLPTRALEIVSAGLGVISRILNKNNPLPMSRVSSMTQDHIVDLSCNDRIEKMYQPDSLLTKIREDFSARYDF